MISDPATSEASAASSISEQAWTRPAKSQASCSSALCFMSGSFVISSISSRPSEKSDSHTDVMHPVAPSVGSFTGSPSKRWSSLLTCVGARYSGGRGDFSGVFSDSCAPLLPGTLSVATETSVRAAASGAV